MTASSRQSTLPRQLMLALALTVPTGLPGLASGPAADTGQYLAQRPVNEAGARITRDEAADAARRAVGGRVLNVRFSRRGGGTYRVRVLLENERVRTVRVDAKSGRVLD